VPFRLAPLVSLPKFSVSPVAAPPLPAPISLSTPLLQVLFKIAEKVKNFTAIYLVDISEVPDFNKMYELYDPCTVMFFFRNKHIMIDLGTGNNNKINWAMEDPQEMIDIVETVYRGARKGRGLVISPKDYSTKYRY
jgi:U5 snRNP protein, DIM1 family